MGETAAGRAARVARTAVRMPHSPQIEKTCLTATAPNGQVVAAVIFTNGRCGLLLDDQPVDGLDWPVDRMADCTAALLRLAGLKE